MKSSNILYTSINTKQDSINSTVGQLIIGNGNGKTTTNNSLTFTNNDTLNAPKFVGNGSGLTNLPSASQWTGTTNIFYNLGNVGIGTTNPINELHIFDSTTSATSITIQNNSPTLGTPSIELVRGTQGDSNTDYKLGNYDGNFKVISSSLTTDIERLNITSGNYTTEIAIQSISPLPSIISSTPAATSTGILGTDRYMTFIYTTDSSGYTNQSLYTLTLDDNYTFDILVVGGGGGGGQGVYCGGGGGGGGVVYMVEKTFVKGTYKIIVGKGGVAGTVGNDSVIRLSNDTTISYDGISVIGKGGGPAGGGSGGSGAGGNKNGGAGSATQGNTVWNGSSYVAGGFNGQGGGAWNGGGGGGAGEAGGTDGGLQGGDGRAFSITGTSTFYGGGGAGGGDPSVGGDGGGGNTGGWGSGGGNGTPGTGGGGGGAFSPSMGPGGVGGSGVIILRYRQSLPQLESSINLVRGTANDTNRDYKIGNYGGDFIVKSSVSGVDTDYIRIVGTSASIFNSTASPQWSTVSDRRIKENIEKASYDKCFDTINKLELYRFNYIKELNSINKDKTQLGYIAQEVNDVFPKAVSSYEFNNTMLSIPDLLSIDIAQINYSLYGAVKKLIEINNNKEVRLKKLESILNIECDSSNIAIIKDTITSNIVIEEAMTSNIVIEDTITSNIVIDDTVTSNIVIEGAITSNIVIEEAMTSNIVIEEAMTSNV